MQRRGRGAFESRHQETVFKHEQKLNKKIDLLNEVVERLQSDVFDLKQENARLHAGQVQGEGRGHAESDQRSCLQCQTCR